jgi:putative photosynthetic complex assembly protein 2
VADYGLPVLYALFLWWFSTGLILYLDGLPARTYRWSMLGATALLGAALYGLARSSADPSVGGAYVAFTCGLVIWGWHEISLLMGYVTGPRRTPCPEGCGGWRHAVHATQTILYHEIAIAATAAAVVALTWGGANQVGAWTFMILWGMRLSAKLNVFLGVPNLSEEFLPEQLHYLKSYLAKKPMNLLFPVSVTVSTVIAALLVRSALAADASAFEVAGFVFLAALLALAILEHWFLVLPLPDAALWSWALRSRPGPGPENVVEPEPKRRGLRPCAAPATGAF